MKKFITLLLLLLLPSMVFPQKIIKVIKEYVLINSDQGIGNIGDIIEVNRDIKKVRKRVGRVLIVKFRNGMTACKILEGSIKIGDYIKSNDDQIVDELFSVGSRQPDVNTTSNNKSEIGLSCGAFFPTGDISDWYSTSFVLSGFMSLSISNHYNAVFEISYPFLKLNSELKDALDYFGINFNASLLMINAYGRFRIDPSFFIDIGGGIYIPKLSISADGANESSSEAGIGICLGPTFLLNNSLTYRLSLSAKYHTYIIEAHWAHFIKADLQISFNLSR